MQALWWILLIASAAVYLVSAGYAVPRAFFRPGFDITASFDRGLKNYKEPGGRSIVYEPPPQYKKYIRQYILSDRGGKKALLCKPDEGLTHIDYDVALFNRRRRVFKVLNIREELTRPGYTQITPLPDETCYAALTVRAADGNAVSHPRHDPSKRRFACFSAAAGLLTVAELFLVKLCLAFLFGDVFGESFMLDVAGIFITLGIGLTAAFAYLAAAVVYHKRKNQRDAGGAR